MHVGLYITVSLHNMTVGAYAITVAIGPMVGPNGDSGCGFIVKINTIQDSKIEEKNFSVGLQKCKM